jgi:hypothetical protein
VVPKERLLTSMRLLLDNPDFADQVVLDLSRWEDWSVLDRLVTMFKQSDKKGYVRQPVVTYLTVAAEQPGDVGQRATAALAELEAFDPETVKQARSLMAFGALSRAKPAGNSPGSDSAGDKEKATSADDTQAFAASADDNDDTDPATIADPAAYEKAPQGDQPTAKKKEDAASPNAVAGADSSEAVSTTASKVETAPQADANSVARTPEAVAEANPAPSPLLIVGVPLVAAGLLMGVYWMILRAGAV